MPKPLEEVREPLNVLYIGDSGTGKTTDLAHLAQLGKVLFVNAESGLKRAPLKRLGVKVENIEVFPGEPQESITFSSLEKEWLRIREALHEDPEAYAGVIWDSATEIHKALLEKIVERDVEKAQRQGRERERFFISRDNWGVLTEQMRNLLRKYRDLECHFGMSTLARRDQDDDGAVTYNPALSPALQNDAFGWVDMVCHTSVISVDGTDEVQYRGLFVPLGKYRAKDRLGVMPRILVDPSFDRLLAYAEGLTVDKDEVMQAVKQREKRNKQKAAAKSGGEE